MESEALHVRMDQKPRAQRDRIRSRDELWMEGAGGFRRERTHSKDQLWIEAAKGVPAMESEALHVRMDQKPRAQRERICSRDELWMEGARGVRRERTHSKDQLRIEAAEGVPAMEQRVRSLSNDLGDMLLGFESYLDRANGSTSVLDNLNGSTSSVGVFGKCDFDLEEPQVKDCPRPSFDALYPSPLAVPPRAPDANDAAQGLFRDASVESSDTIVSADAGLADMRAAQIARMRAAQTARIGMAFKPLGAPMHVPTAGPNYADGICSFRWNQNRVLLTSRPWGELRLHLKKVQMHKVLNEGMPNQENVISNARNFSVEIELLGMPDLQLAANPLDVRATLRFENFSLVHPFSNDMGTPLLVGDTEATMCNGGVAMRLKMGPNSLSTHMDRRRFLIRVEPRDEALRYRYTMLTDTSEAFKSITKLERKPRLKQTPCPSAIATTSAP